MSEDKLRGYVREDIDRACQRVKVGWVIIG